MDDRLAQLEHRVAAAADAWLADPRDAQVYARLVHAIEGRRAFLNPQVAVGTSTRPHVDTDRSGVLADVGAEVLDDLGQDRAPEPVGHSMGEVDPRALLERLRRSPPAG